MVVVVSGNPEHRLDVTLRFILMVDLATLLSRNPLLGGF